MSAACHCDYDPADFYRKTERKARKFHHCYECNGGVQPGEIYEHVSAKWEGQVDSFATCCRCVALRKWVLAHVPCFCWHHGNMRDEARETINEYKHEAPGLWFGWARREIAIRKMGKARRVAAKALAVTS